MYILFACIHFHPRLCSKKMMSLAIGLKRLRRFIAAGSECVARRRNSWGFRRDIVLELPLPCDGWEASLATKLVPEDCDVYGTLFTLRLCVNETEWVLIFHYLGYGIVSFHIFVYLFILLLVFLLVTLLSLIFMIFIIFGISFFFTVFLYP